MRANLILIATTMLSGCASRADQVFTAPGRLASGSAGAQPGYALKRVRAKQPPTEVMADDGSICRLTAERFADVEPGSWITCEWTIAPDTTETSAGGHEREDLDPGLVASFANVTDSISFSDSRHGNECCWQTLLTLRPRGTWTFVRVDTTVRWFETPADSVMFRAVTARLLQLGFVGNWPASFNSSDGSSAVFTLRAPGQCHQTGASFDPYAEPLPEEWAVARAMLNSLAADVRWQVRSPPAWALADRYRILPRAMCGGEIWQ